MSDYADQQDAPTLAAYAGWLAGQARPFVDFRLELEALHRDMRNRRPVLPGNPELPFPDSAQNALADLVEHVQEAFRYNWWLTHPEQLQQDVPEKERAHDVACAINGLLRMMLAAEGQWRRTQRALAALAGGEHGWDQTALFEAFDPVSVCMTELIKAITNTLSLPLPAVFASRWAKMQYVVACDARFDLLRPLAEAFFQTWHANPSVTPAHRCFEQWCQFIHDSRATRRDMRHVHQDSELLGLFVTYVMGIADTLATEVGALEEALSDTSLASKPAEMSTVEFVGLTSNSVGQRVDELDQLTRDLVELLVALDDTLRSDRSAPRFMSAIEKASGLLPRLVRLRELPTHELAGAGVHDDRAD